MKTKSQVNLLSTCNDRHRQREEALIRSAEVLLFPASVVYLSERFQIIHGYLISSIIFCWQNLLFIIPCNAHYVCRTNEVERMIDNLLVRNLNFVSFSCVKPEKAFFDHFWSLHRTRQRFAASHQSPKRNMTRHKLCFRIVKQIISVKFFLLFKAFFCWSLPSDNGFFGLQMFPWQMCCKKMQKRIKKVATSARRPFNVSIGTK